MSNNQNKGKLYILKALYIIVNKMTKKNMRPITVNITDEMFEYFDRNDFNKSSFIRQTMLEYMLRNQDGDVLTKINNIEEKLNKMIGEVNKRLKRLEEKNGI
jgi:hypothetical protein